MKTYCSECKWFKFLDSDGFGWCELWEEADVNSGDEACVEFAEHEERGEEACDD